MQRLLDAIQSENGEQRESLIQRLIVASSTVDAFEAGRIYYDLYLSPSRYDAIDFHGIAQARQLDLNYPINLDFQYDIVLNNGTAEHIFNIAQVFRTIHDHTKAGGLMVHEMPFTNWLNHGFYNLNPVILFDLAETNGYEMISVHIGVFGDTSLIELKAAEDASMISGLANVNTVLVGWLRMPAEKRPFVIPQQGCYAILSDGRRVVAPP